MKKVVIALFVALLSTTATSAGEDPKLLKEIQRKVKVDLSGIKLEKSREHFVVVHFRIVDKEIEVLDVQGSKRELTDLMLQELEEMFITSNADPKKIYHFKFNFSQE